MGPCKADKLVPTCVAAVAAEEAALQTAERSGEEESAATSSTRTGRQRGAAAASRIRNKKRHLPFPGRARKSSSSRILERLHQEKFYREACKRAFAGGLFSGLIRGLSLLVVRRVEVIPLKDELFWISPYKFSDVFACTFFPCCLVNPAPLPPPPPPVSQGWIIPSAL